MYDNNKAFDEGIKKMYQTVYEHLIWILRSFCDDLFRSADAEKHYKNLTGNTFTSYACGIYNDSALIEILLSSDYKKPPIRLKLTKGDVFVGTDYDGRTRSSFSASVNTDGGFGDATSMTFLRSYRPNVSKGLSVVMCTGTEYSEFIEQVGHKNVLTNTFLYSQGLFFKNLRPI